MFKKLNCLQEKPRSENHHTCVFLFEMVGGTEETDIEKYPQILIFLRRGVNEVKGILKLLLPLITGNKSYS